MSQQELLEHVVGVLDAIGIEYMVTGSLASSLQGEPRATHDIDLVVALTQPQVPLLVRAFPAPAFYLDEATVREAIEHRGMFNLLDTREGDKVDFWILTDEDFDRSRFARRYSETIQQRRFVFSQPEDTILMKLKWARDSGGSEKQYGDALRVYEIQAERLDLDYVETWVRRLGVESLWRRLLSEAETV